MNLSFDSGCSQHTTLLTGHLLEASASLPTPFSSPWLHCSFHVTAHTRALRWGETRREIKSLLKQRNISSSNICVTYSTWKDPSVFPSRGFTYFSSPHKARHKCQQCLSGHIYTSQTKENWCQVPNSPRIIPTDHPNTAEGRVQKKSETLADSHLGTLILLNISTDKRKQWAK